MAGGLERIAEHYRGKLRYHGAGPAGVGWVSPESQELRHTQLLRVCGRDRTKSINDYGCGYGALAARLRRDGFSGDYVGYDISPDMIRAAMDLQKDLEQCRFTSNQHELPRAAYTLASGLFHLRLDIPIEAWERHIRETIEHMAEISTVAFAFNMLSTGTEGHVHTGDQYYADPVRWLAICLRRFPRRVALAHDYSLNEFTVMVRSRTF
jgi:SAM-dependent methyltransferase